MLNTRRLLPALRVMALVAVAASCVGPTGQRMATSVDGTAISFDVRGKGEPALIFVHGWSGDRTGWRYQVGPFSEERTVVTLDLAGFGASGTGRRSWTVTNFAEDVSAVVRALDIEEAVLVGHSMGSGVIVEAALKMPDRIIGLVPVDVFQNVEEKLSTEQMNQRADRLIHNVNHPDRDYLAAAFNNRLDAEVLDEIVQSYEASAKIGWRESLIEFMTWRSNELTGALRRIQVPIVCINSGRRPTDLVAARRHAPSFEVEVIDGVNHAIMLEAPDEFNAVLQLILERHHWVPRTTP